jgi:hypothetical protein
VNARWCRTQYRNQHRRRARRPFHRCGGYCLHRRHRASRFAWYTALDMGSISLADVWGGCRDAKRYKHGRLYSSGSQMTASLIGHLGQALCDGRWPDRSRGSRFSSQSIGSSRRSRCTHAWDQGLESLAYGRAQSAAVIVGFIHPVVRMGRSGQDRLRWLCQIMQRPPIRTGTRCHRSTYDAVRRQSCVRQQRWLAAVLWSSSAARPMLSSCSRQSSA